ncbi:MAG: DUF1036 domain-containing protein [Hyphomicrobiaceae bacterium]
MLDAIPRRLILAAAGLLLFLSTPASADLKICNTTTGRVGVALGYQGAKGWVTEGWWTIAGESCETLLRGKPKSRVFYVHAVDYDRGGEWAGTTALCTDDKAFVIQGETDCEQRGHKRAGFMEVDTNNAPDWTIRLGDPPEQESK